MSENRNKLAAREGMDVGSGKIMKVANRKVIHPNKVQQLIDDAWMGIDIPEEVLYNPLDIIPRTFEDDPHLFLTWMITRPEYIYAFCKQILNVTLWPLQAMAIKEMWTHRFPLLACTRGYSKCMVAGTKIITSNGFANIEELCGDGEPHEKVYSEVKILGENGYQELDYAWNNGHSKTIELSTRHKYTIEGTLNHPIRVVSNGEITWKNLEDVKIGDYTVIDRNNKWHDSDVDHISEELAYVLGLIIGDGGYTSTNVTVSYTTADPELLNKINEVIIPIYGKGFVDVPSSKYGYAMYSRQFKTDLFERYGFNSSVCGEKDLPDWVWKASEKKVAALIRGLFDTDGWVAMAGGVGLAAKSKNLIKNVQFLLTRFGIFSSFKRQYNKTYDRYYHKVELFGENYKIFKEKIGFGLKKKRNKLEKICQKPTNTNVDILPHGLVLDKLLSLRDKYAKVREPEGHGYHYKRQLLSPWRIKKYQVSYETLKNMLEIMTKVKEEPEWIFLDNLISKHYFFDAVEKLEVKENTTYDIHLKEDHSFISNGFISHNSYSLAVQAILRGLFLPGRKVIITGASFRQSKIIFEYIEGIYRNSPLLRDLIANGKRDDQIIVHDSSMWSFRIGDSRIMCIPMGSGDTIRGLRANDIYNDETSSVNRNIFENVVAGFGVVSSSPLENIKKEASKRKREELGIAEELVDIDPVAPNQIILSGTCYYRFNHFFDYFNKYREIIRSNGDRNRLRKVVGDEIDNPAFDWKDYCIIRIPYTLLPKGYIDLAQVSRSKVSVTASNFLCEYEACFASDSDGFFRRTLIERCVPNDNNIIRVNNTIVDFVPRLNGNEASRYVIAIDPASENDNCAIEIIELRDDHRRIVYGWTTNKKLHRKNLAVHRTQEDNYWAFVVRKIRDLMKRFPTVAIAIDSQGGGNSIMEGLHDKDKMEPNEVPIWPIFGDAKHGEWCDIQDGQHIIHMINFASAEWLGNAYFNTKKDMEEQLLLFPSFDGATMGLTDCVDDSKFIEGGLDDSMEALIDEIEELKNELTCIIHTKTPSGRDQFTVPDIKTAEGKKAKVKKDRASALIMANAVGRSIMRDFIDSTYEVNGGFASPLKELKGALYTNPWYSNGVGDAYESYAN